MFPYFIDGDMSGILDADFSYFPLIFARGAIKPWKNG